VDIIPWSPWKPRRNRIPSTIIHQQGRSLPVHTPCSRHRRPSQRPPCSRRRPASSGCRRNRWPTKELRRRDSEVYADTHWYTKNLKIRHLTWNRTIINYNMGHFMVISSGGNSSSKATLAISRSSMLHFEPGTTAQCCENIFVARKTRNEWRGPHAMTWPSY